MALRNSVIVDVWSAIERSPFSPADFEVVTEGRDFLLKITFRHNTAYVLTLSKGGSNSCMVFVSPGAHETQEHIPIENASKVPAQVLAWTRNIRDELRTVMPVYSELEELRETIERHVMEHVENPHQNFSQEESDALRTKLDDLMIKFQEMQERHELTQQEVNRLNEEISSIKVNLGGYPKGTWYKTAANKLWLAVGKVGTSKESREVLAKAAQKLLGLDD